MLSLIFIRRSFEELTFSSRSSTSISRSFLSGSISFSSKFSSLKEISSSEKISFFRVASSISSLLFASFISSSSIRFFVRSSFSSLILVLRSSRICSFPLMDSSDLSFISMLELLSFLNFLMFPVIPSISPLRSLLSFSFLPISSLRDRNSLLSLFRSASPEVNLSFERFSLFSRLKNSFSLELIFLLNSSSCFSRESLLSISEVFSFSSCDLSFLFSVS